MKVALLTESPADEAAICILLRKLLEVEIEPIPRRPRAGGWNAVINAIPPTVKELHYRRTASALVVVIDSDDSIVHQRQHDAVGSEQAECRLCALRTLVNQVQNQLQPQSGARPIDLALAVAVPAIEAWYLCGRECSEALWLMKQQQGIRSKAEVARLKRLVYGTDRPSLQLEIERASDCATRQTADLAQLQDLFPESFGRFAAEVRSWILR